MQVVHSVKQLREARRAMDGRVGLVPTMGALHDGHMSLVELARQHADRVVVSIFVNPTQFGPNEDFHRYPRPIEDDLARCEREGVDLVFNPPVEEIYRQGLPAAHVTIPALESILEGAIRPGHFAGVCRVCAKLFNMVQPDVAVFGRKDYQQLAVIQAMVADLAMPLQIVPAPTMRESDGLAMSSRNRYLQGEDRRRAVGLWEALQEARRLALRENATDVQGVEEAMRQTMAARQIAVDYAVLRDPRSLGELDAMQLPAVALVAGRLGATRLIDNLLIEQPA